MILELKPGQQRVLDRAARSGMSPEEVLDQAFSIIDEQDRAGDWMEAERAVIAAGIEEGFRQAELGELVDCEQASQMIRERRTDRRIAWEMLPRYQFTPRTINDLIEIWSTIADDNVDAANRVESAIDGACDSLASHPLLGSKRKEITQLPVRFWTVTRFPNFTVVYRPDSQPIQVVAVLHGMRNIAAVLEEPEDH